MGGFLDKPETKKDARVGHGNGLRYCVSSMQGWRTEMEDTHTAVCGLREPYNEWSFFAVFDGHAGKQISTHCAKFLLSTILGTDPFSQSAYVSGIKKGFLVLDEEMQKHHDLSGGSTATCVFLSAKKMYFANCGDSRVVLSRNGKVMFSTVDHKPTCAAEKKRIDRAGGSVMINRVNGTLAVSRAFGDFDFKSDVSRGVTDQLVIAQPDITVLERFEKDEFLVVACDGIWDVMTSAEVCAFIHSRLRVSDDLPEIVNTVLDVCLHKGSRDNMSLMLVILPGAPKINLDAISADKTLDKNIAQITREVMVKNEVYDYEVLVQLMKKLANNIPNLPPGGGLYAKYHVIENTFYEAFPNKPREFYDYYAI